MAVIETALGRQHHRDNDQLLDRVDPERGTEDAAPEIFADRARQWASAGGGAHGKAKAEAVAHFGHGCECPEPRAGRIAVAAIGRQMIGRHECHALRCQQPGPIELAAVQQHLAEPEIVGSGRYSSAAARDPAARVGDVAHRRSCPARRIDLRLGDTRRPFAGCGEPRVAKTERPADPRVDEIGQILPRYDLDDPPEDVGLHAVFPGRPRLEHQRQGGELGH
jgi:hypothetical protein